MADDVNKKLEPVPVAVSKTEVAHLVLPSHANALGTIFGGQLMSWIDLAAAIAAKRHSRRICVTASIDEMNFIQPVRVGETVVLKASVNYAGTSSMEVGVRVEKEDMKSGDRIHMASAYLTFVAVDEFGRPVPVPGLTLESEADTRHHAAALKRREQRLKRKGVI